MIAVLATMEDWAFPANGGPTRLTVQPEFLPPADHIHRAVAGREEGKCCFHFLPWSRVSVFCRIKLLDRSSSAPTGLPLTRRALDDAWSGKQAPTATTQTGDW